MQIGERGDARLISHGEGSCAIDQDSTDADRCSPFDVVPQRIAHMYDPIGRSARKLQRPTVHVRMRLDVALDL